MERLAQSICVKVRVKSASVGQFPSREARARSVTAGCGLSEYCRSAETGGDKSGKETAATIRENLRHGTSYAQLVRAIPILSSA